jgi:hypothetical protein
MCIEIKKYITKLKTTLRIASTSSCLVLLKEFGPYIIAVVSLVAKTTWLDRYVGWAIRLAIQSMMDNGFGPKRSTTFFFHVLQMPRHYFLLDLK